jgi:hypothetical protein
MFTREGVIYLRKDLIEEWETFGVMRRKGVNIGWFPSNTHDPVANLIHEATHSLIEGMSPAKKKELMVAILKSYKTWPVQIPDGIEKADIRFIRRIFDDPKMKEAFAKRVSVYGSTDFDEMLSEALSEYLTSPSPRAIAETVGDFLTATAKKARPANPWRGQDTLTLRNVEQSKLIGIHSQYITTAKQTVDEALKEQVVWSWFDDADLDDLDVDIRLLRNADRRVAEDIKMAYRKVMEAFPGLKMPRIQMMPYTTNDPMLNMSFAFYLSDTGYVYLPVASVREYDEISDLVKIGEAKGWFTEGLFEQHQVLIHELGHHISYNMTRLDYKKMFEWLAAEIPNGGSAQSTWFSTVINGIESLTSPNDSPHEILQWIETVRRVSFASMGGTVVGDYGRTQFREMFAELFAKGILDIEEGVHSQASRFVELLQGMDLGRGGSR